MKIYPNKSNIVATKEVNLSTDIPLSYIDTNSVSYDINTVISEGLNIKSKKEILPYDRLDKNILCLFDKNEQQINHNELLQNLKKDGKEYVYIPNGSKSFIPKAFIYNVIGKKKMKYYSNTPYNIKALVPNNINLANSLMSILGDAPQRLLAPGNITVNNGDLSLDSLTEGNMYKNDFTFFEYANFKEIIEYGPDGKSPHKILYNAANAIEQMTTNIVMVVQESFMVKDYGEEDYDEEDKKDSVPKTLEEQNYISEEEPFSTLVEFRKSKDSKVYRLKNSMLYDSVTINTKKYFTIPKNTSKSIYHNFFDNSGKAPILVEERIGQGFLIYMPESIIRNAVVNSKLIYEIMAKVYFNAYLKTDDTEEWIADKMPDFIVSNKKLIKKDKFISNIEVYKMFDLSEGDIETYAVNIDKKIYPYVDYIGISNNYLIFQKNIEGDNKKYADLEKPKNSISIYTQNKTIMYYDDFIYAINDSLEDCLNIERVNNEVVINLKPYRNSSKGIYIKNIIEPLTIPLTSVSRNKTEEQIRENTYYLITKQNESASYFEIVDKTIYEADDNITLLAIITVKQKNDSNMVYDMRQRGGGLNLGEEDNFDCFDIGHILGRPYRKSNTLIITLPAYLKDHKDIVLQTVKQHCVAEDYPIILFKED